MSKQKNLIEASQNVTFDTSGKVGIGTSSPAAPLDVVATGQAAQFSTAAGQTHIQLTDTTNSKSGFLNYNNDVLQYFSSGPVERMRIDSAGRVTTPYQPMCDIQLNGNTTATGPYSTHTAHVNVGGYWNTSTHRFTAPVAGKYEVSASAYTNYTSSYGYYAFFKNGTNTQTMHFNNAGMTGHTMMGYTRILELSANDYVQFGRTNSQGTGWFDVTFMTVQLIG